MYSTKTTTPSRVRGEAKASAQAARIMAKPQYMGLRLYW